jgi:hypothetical protein
MDYCPEASVLFDFQNASESLSGDTEGNLKWNPAKYGVSLIGIKFLSVSQDKFLSESHAVDSETLCLSK